MGECGVIIWRTPLGIPGQPNTAEHSDGKENRARDIIIRTVFSLSGNGGVLLAVENVDFLLALSRKGNGLGQRFPVR
jgi:hypothetical protein